MGGCYGGPVSNDDGGDVLAGKKIETYRIPVREVSLVDI